MNSSESEDGLDDNFHSPWSLSHDNEGDKSVKNFKDDDKISRIHDTHSTGSKVRHQKSFGWEIIEGVKAHTVGVDQPSSEKGIIYRRRKWPMKGWCKIYISLESGIMAYSKSNTQFSKRHFDGEIDLGLAVVTYKTKRYRIDIDADRTFFHFKVKEGDLFQHWVSTIRSHRLFRQWKLMKNYGTDDTDVGVSESWEPQINDRTLSALDNIANLSSAIGASTYIDRHAIFQKNNSNLSLDKITPELVRTLTLAEDSNDDVPSKSLVLMDEDLKFIQKKLSDLSETYQDLLINMKGMNSTLSASNPSLAGTNRLTANGEVKSSKPVSQMLSPDLPQLKMVQFNVCANEVFTLLQSTFKKLSLERENVVASGGITSRRDNSLPKNIKNMIKELTHQNNDLKARLSRIIADATLPYLAPTLDIPMSQGSLSASTTEDYIAENVDRRESRNTSGVTNSEMFYDAAEFLNSDSGSSISETEEIDDISDAEEELPLENLIKRRTQTLYQEKTGRRDKLPAIQPDISQFSLMNLLCKNIGRDLSKVRLPVILNEPLSALQMLCEDLEYSDVLDSASNCIDPLERMQYLAAFAVSGYASSFHRAGTKPFNPVIGETYEYVRPDKGWKFIAEQVSHHPPISVCYCESESWILWQEFRLKNKFWGKSIEAVPTGSIKVTFKNFNETVTWNKVTTCIYNIFGQNRYVEHYGDMNFSSSLGSFSKITFHKSNSWVHQKYEVSGTVSTVDSKKCCQLFGKWTEGIYVGDDARCIWRPGTMPADHEKYYGFTMFAIDLNNLDDELGATIPRTDARLRPDQKYLEMGMISEAETEKTRVEEIQRTRLKKVNGDENWVPMWFKKVDSGKSCVFEFKNTYWFSKARLFKDVVLPELW